MMTRTALCAIVCGFAATVSATSGPARAAGLSSPPTVVLARDVRNGWGVCGRPGSDASIAAYATMLDMIGTRDVRTPVTGGGKSFAGDLATLRQVMMRTNLPEPAPKITALVSAYTNDPASTWTTQQKVLLQLASDGLLRAVEGPNEINNPVAGGGAHGPDDMDNRSAAGLYPRNLRAWAEALHDFRQRNQHAFTGITFVAPSIAAGSPDDYKHLPNLSGVSGAGNFHFYAGGGRQPDFSMLNNPAVGSFDNVFMWARTAEIGRGAIWLTETGASTSGNYAQSGVSQAKYIANQMLEFFAAGGTRLFLYSLIDQPGAADNTESNFGLFRRDGAPKPVARMLARFKDLVSLGRYADPRNAADSGPVTPGQAAEAVTLNWSAAPPGAEPRALILAKSDRSILIAVWNEARIDDGAGHDVTPAGVEANVAFGGTRSFQVHDLMQEPNDAAVRTGDQVSVTLRGYPLWIELRPPG